MVKRFLGLAALVLAFPAQAEEDPLRSGMWDLIHEHVFDGAPMVFDDRVQVRAPASAEDNLVVPATIDARALDGVVKIAIVADLNPIPVVAYYRPVQAEPYLGLELKLQQGGPVRAAALTKDGTWHVGGTFVDAAGGGCTAPATVHASADWPDHLGEVWGRTWPEPEGVQRLKLRVYHPMDTGLADGIPAFFLDDILISDENGELLAEILPLEPVSEHPVFTLLLKPGQSSASVHVYGRDTDANEFDADVPLNWRMSALDSQAR